MYQELIPYKQSFVHTFFYGSGPEWLICFHGFGEEGKSFEILESHLGKAYTIIAIDFPFHGETVWNEGLLMTADDLLNVIGIATETDPVKIKFSILAYSLGGRIALHLLQIIPSQIKGVVLLAPDGLRLNFWYWLGTQTYAGNKLFSYTMKHPGWFFFLVDICGKIKLLNKSIIKFVHYYLDDKEVRLLLYKRWTTMRKFKPALQTVRSNIALYKTPVRFVFGNYDRIILAKRSSQFENIPSVNIIVLQAGHQLLKEKYAGDIAALFSQ